MSIEDNEIIAAEEVVAETPVEPEVATIEESVVEELIIEEPIIEEPTAQESKIEEPVSKKTNSKKTTVNAVITESPIDIPETVAIYSTKNVFWKGVGEIKRGYNIVSKQHAELWLQRIHVRLATPQDIARELNN